MSVDPSKLSLMSCSWCIPSRPMSQSRQVIRFSLWTLIKTHHWLLTIKCLILTLLFTETKSMITNQSLRQISTKTQAFVTYKNQAPIIHKTISIVKLCKRRFKRNVNLISESCLKAHITQQPGINPQQARSDECLVTITHRRRVKSGNFHEQKCSNQVRSSWRS